MPQKAAHKEHMFVVNSSDVAFERLAKKGAKNSKVRYLIDERQGSDKFSLRIYTIQKGGHTPLDYHEYEHHVYILSGQGILNAEDKSSTSRNT
jgi:quercetin dioxygenase-like cupin family protein